MSEHNAEAVEAAVEAVLPSLRARIRNDGGHAAEEWLRRVAFDVACAAVDAATPAIREAERARLYAQLGNDHYVIFTEDDWTTEHSVECRLSGRMSECGHHTAMTRVIGRGAPVAGRWRITGIDGDGLPDLVRADREPG